MEKEKTQTTFEDCEMKEECTKKYTGKLRYRVQKVYHLGYHNHSPFETVNVLQQEVLRVPTHPHDHNVECTWEDVPIMETMT